MNLLPVFSSHHSIGRSLLTLEEPGKAKTGNPISVFDLAKEVGLTQVTLCESRIDGFVQAYKTSLRTNTQLVYGVKLTVCANMGDKSPESRRTESRVVVLIRGGAVNAAGLPQGYSDLLRLWNQAWGKPGHFRYRKGGDVYSYGRLDWDTLNALWTENLLLVLPYFSSFIAKNTLTFNQITPKLPMGYWLFREVECGLPFAPLLDAAIDRYVGQEMSPVVVPIKTVYYRDSAAFKAYVTFRAISNKGTFHEPNVDHLWSDQFSWESYKQLAARQETVSA